MDNNETYSALNHAYNLWHFDFFNSFGLTDEAVSPDPAAHPIVHTHQGNFPRLFAFLLYALGARSAESQIWITTFTVGLASILMAYCLFRRMGGSLFAACAVLLLTTDYLMFGQWQVNTYRVWHGFFLFGALLCAHGLAEWKRWRWFAATVALYAGLFYWELVFAFFVSVTAGLYTGWINRKRPATVLVGWLTQGLGASLGLAAVIVQLALYLGWEDFLTDLRFTLTARNASPDSQAFLEQLRAFYESRGIAFFYNLSAAGEHAGPLVFLRSLFRNILQIPTPILSLLALAMAAAAFIGDARAATVKDLSTPSRRLAPRNVIVVAVGVGVLLCALLSGGAVIGERPSFPDGPLGWLAGLALLGIALSLAVARGLLRLAAGLSELGNPPSLERGERASGFLIALAFLILVEGQAFDQDAAGLWRDIVTPFPLGLARLLVALVAIAGSLIILAGRRATFGRWHETPARFAPFLICGLLAYIAVYRLSGGYLHSGYLDRLAPFPVFFFDALLGFGVFSAIALGVTVAGRIPVLPARWTGRSAAALAASVVLAFAAGWSIVQIRYYRLVPPDQFAFTRLLQRSDIRGAGLVSTSYAVPFGLEAGTWAYIGEVTDVVAAVRNNEDLADNVRYLWLADKANPAYRRPALYVCFEADAAYSSLVADTWPQTAPRYCSPGEIGRRLASAADVVTPSIVAYDDARHRWAIVRLEWTTQ